MVKGYCKFQMLDKAIGILDIMMDKQVKPDEVLYNSILDGCSKCGKLDLAFEIYNTMCT